MHSKHSNLVARLLIATIYAGLIGLLPLAGVAQDDAYDEFLNGIEDEFDSLITTFEDEYDSAVARHEREYAEFVAKIELMWDQVLAPSEKEYVEYDETCQKRTAVDFEAGEIEVAVVVDLDEAEVDPDVGQERIRRAVRESVGLRPRIEVYSVKDDAERFQDKLMPKGLIEDKQGAPVTEENLDSFVDESTRRDQIVVDTIVAGDGRRRIKLSTTYAMVPDALDVLARQYLDLVLEQADRFDLDPRMVFAVIHTESYFNPLAISHEPAYGLMQIVPSSGGVDAYHFLYGRKRVLKPAYLYDARKNVELGTAYLVVLRDKYLKGVDGEHRKYPLMIAAYNGGIGKVARAMTGSGKLGGIPDVANGMTPEQIVQRLVERLNMQETQDYLINVQERMKYYDSYLDARM